MMSRTETRSGDSRDIRGIDRADLSVPDGRRIAVFYTKLYQRLRRPLLSADTPPARPQLRQALATIAHHVDSHLNPAKLRAAA